MDFGCNEFANFIEKLYDFFNETEMCFLSGSMVFDNDGQWLYRSLMKGHRLTKNCSNVSSRFSSSSHLSFLKQSEFKEARDAIGGTEEYMIRDSPSAKQYDKKIGRYLTYLCDKRCRATPTPPDCLPGDREPKGIGMFYPFSLVKSDDQTVSIDYLFMKLEQYETSPTHPINATKHLGHYFQRRRGHEKVMTHPKRREDDKLVVPENATNDFDIMVKYYTDHGATEDQVEQLKEKITFFNKNVRTRNEVYVPSEILGIILKTKLPGRQFKKVVKGLIALNRMQKDSIEIGTDSWIRGRVNLFRRSHRSPFPGQTCMTATYPNSKNVKTRYSREQLLVMAKYMGLAVTDDMTKQQLCDIITPGR